MQDNAKGTVLVEDDGIIPKKTFCLDTGGTVAESEDIKGTGLSYKKQGYHWKNMTYLSSCELTIYNSL